MTRLRKKTVAERRAEADDVAKMEERCLGYVVHMGRGGKCVAEDDTR